MNKGYDDIIDLPRPVSKKHPQMSLIDRAAQFSPFAALTGYNAAIKETARLTDERVELTEYTKETLRRRLQIIAERLKEHPEISITYFCPDNKKNGGTYITVTAIVKKLNDYDRILLMEDGKVIPIDEIVNIEGDIFEAISM